MEFTIILGLMAGLLTTLASIPQIIKSWKTRKTRDISTPWIVLTASGVFLWLFYGFLARDIPLMAANSVSIVLLLSLLVMKLRFG